jgi:hypothetical protein
MAQKTVDGAKIMEASSVLAFKKGYELWESCTRTVDSEQEHQT